VDVQRNMSEAVGDLLRRLGLRQVLSAASLNRPSRQPTRSTNSRNWRNFESRTPSRPSNTKSTSENCWQNSHATPLDKPGADAAGFLSA
jgi:hypothetical protein